MEPQEELKTFMQSCWQKRKNPFRLPMSATFSVHQREDHKWVAHSLDFDLVSVADSKEKVLQKLRLCVKVYIEYGLENNWAEDIIFPAPDEYWERLSNDDIVEMMPTISIHNSSQGPVLSSPI